MKLVYDNVTRTTSNTEGVETRIPGFGNTTSVEWLDPSEAYPGAYFKDIANMLIALGYERNISLRGAPYDFRKAPNENGDYFIRLKELIEETYIINDNSPVILLAHSMGGPMTLHFLHMQSKSWKEKYIRALITLSGAWGGSVKALKVFVVGDDLGSYVLRESVMKEEQITSPSLAWLLPSSLFWSSEEVLVQTSDKNYTVNDFQEFFELVYKPKGFPDGYPDFHYGDGDGTVNRRSLKGCLMWEGKQKKIIYHQTFSNLDHMNVLHDQRVLSYIEQLVKN